MRKTLISFAAAASALALATPAAAQWYPQQGYQQGRSFGHQQSQQRARMYQQRVDQLQYQIRQLRDRRILSPQEARQLRQEARTVERNIHGQARYGLSRTEDRNLQRMLARLERRIQRQARDLNRYGNAQAYSPYASYGSAYDRDRDGRDDRYEDDRGYNDDDRWDD